MSFQCHLQTVAHRKKKKGEHYSPRFLVDLIGGVEELDLVPDRLHPGSLPYLHLTVVFEGEFWGRRKRDTDELFFLSFFLSFFLLEILKLGEKENKKKKKTAHHVVPDHLDLGQVPSHLVVQLREPVRDPELESHSRFGELVDVQSLHHALRDVHPTRGLEAVVGDRVWFFFEEQAKLVVLDALLADGAGEVEALVEGEPGVTRRFDVLGLW